MLAAPRPGRIHHQRRLDSPLIGLHTGDPAAGHRDVARADPFVRAQSERLCRLDQRARGAYRIGIAGPGLVAGDGDPVRGELRRDLRHVVDRDLARAGAVAVLVRQHLTADLDMLRSVQDELPGAPEAARASQLLLVVLEHVHRPQRQLHGHLVGVRAAHVGRRVAGRDRGQRAPLQQDHRANSGLGQEMAAARAHDAAADDYRVRRSLHVLHQGNARVGRAANRSSVNEMRAPAPGPRCTSTAESPTGCVAPPDAASTNRCSP